MSKLIFTLCIIPASVYAYVDKYDNTVGANDFKLFVITGIVVLIIYLLCRLFRGKK